MRVSRSVTRVNTTNRMTVAFDVSKGSLNYYSEVRGKVAGNSCHEVETIDDCVTNGTEVVTDTLRMLERFAKERGYAGLHVVCEPTGCYSDCLMHMARRLSCTTAYVSGEVVHKAKVIENNDSSKSDIKDPRVIFLLSKIGKELVYRQLPAGYQRLRELNRLYDEVDTRRVEAKCSMHHVLKRLFCDWPMSNQYVTSASGQALIRLYGLSPYRIGAHSLAAFSRRMRRRVPHIQAKSLQAIHEAARISSRHCLPQAQLQVLQWRMEYLCDTYRIASERRSSLRTEIAKGYEVLLQAGEPVPVADGTVFTAFQLGRVLGETGRLTDFPHWRVLLKYAGLNLRTRESGKFTGQIKLSKKGRAQLRRVLGKLVFRFVKRAEIYGEYYHRRKNQDHMRGTKIMAIVERKLLRLLYSLGRNRQAFNAHRYQTCLTQCRLAA